MVKKKTRFLFFIRLFFIFIFIFIFILFFCQKSSKLRAVWTIHLVQISLACGTNISLRNVWRDLRLLMSVLATVAGKSFYGKFIPKIDFPTGYFMLLIMTLKVLSRFIHYLISIWTTCWWNLNKIVWTELYKILIFLTKKKWLTIFYKVLTPFWKMFLWMKQLFDARLLIKRLSSFSVPKIMVVRHV